MTVTAPRLDAPSAVAPVVAPAALTEPVVIAPMVLARDPQLTLDRDRVRLRHDLPARIPASRGRTSEALLRLLDRPPGSPVDDPDLSWHGSPAEAPTDDDLQLALWLSYELRYRGLAGVHDDWEDQPALLAQQRRWEQQLLAGLEQQVQTRYGSPVTVPAQVATTLEELASAERGPSLSGRLMKQATSAQFAEFLVHRSIYHLKEADPHTWVIPRLSGAVKAAMITIQLDEYGLGATTAMHAQLFRHLLQDWDLDDRYAAQLDHVPGVTLLSSNIISMFGLHRRWRGALVGHLSLFEMTSSTPNGRYARGHRRLGGSEDAAAFFDEHVVADAVHEQIAAHQLAGGLARTEPDLAADIVFGARCAALADDLFGEHVLQAWDAGRSSLRSPARWPIA